MNIQKQIFLKAMLAWLLLSQVAPIKAHNVGWTVSSPGVPGAGIVINGMEGAGEWTGSYMFNISDYGGGNPLSATVKALHKADGIYLLVVIADNTNNNNDAVQIRFDINHSGNPIQNTDWGMEMRRNGQATWGQANADPGTWGNILAGNVGVSSGPASWTAEVRLPTGPPSGLDLGIGTVGVHFMLYDADQGFGLNSAKYTQWPQPPAMTLDALLDPTPNDWGNYVFDPATTFPNLAVTGVRRGDVGPEDYYKISHTANNRFEVRVNNPGGTAVADAPNVRINLYLAARGLGKPWPR